MPLTTQDLTAIGQLLDKQKKEIISDTERKITTAVTNINRGTNGQSLFKDFQTVSKLRSEIQTTEDNLKKALTQLSTDIKKEFETINRRLNLADKRFATIYERFDNIDESLTKISQDLIKYIGEVEVDHKLVHKNFDGRIRLLEKNSGIPL